MSNKTGFTTCTSVVALPVWDPSSVRCSSAGSSTAPIHWPRATLGSLALLLGIRGSSRAASSSVGLIKGQ